MRSTFFKHALTGVSLLLATLSAAALPLPQTNNCGAVALHQLAIALKGTNADTSIIDSAPVPFNGFSMTELLNLSLKAGLDLTPVEVSPDAPIPVPSVVHWKRGHYSAVVERRGDWYRLGDSSFGRRWLKGTVIRVQSRGNFLAS